MLVLCGSTISNYHNKVKLALLEKCVPFTEEHVDTGGSGEALLAQSPLAKIPFIRTEHGALC
ncbi:MAG: glutathione S-transferase N-terminal domain-containing protein, partial [Rhizobacter sp.]